MIDALTDDLTDFIETLPTFTVVTVAPECRTNVSPGLQRVT